MLNVLNKIMISEGYYLFISLTYFIIFYLCKKKIKQTNKTQSYFSLYLHERVQSLETHKRELCKQEKYHHHLYGMSHNLTTHIQV